MRALHRTVGRLQCVRPVISIRNGATSLPRRALMRTVRVVLVATAIGATAGAAVVLSLIDRPAADHDRTASITAHAIVTSVHAAPARQLQRGRARSRPSAQQQPLPATVAATAHAQTPAPFTPQVDGNGHCRQQSPRQVAMQPPPAVTPPAATAPQVTPTDTPAGSDTAAGLRRTASRAGRRLSPSPPENVTRRKRGLRPRRRCRNCLVVGGFLRD